MYIKATGLTIIASFDVSSAASSQLVRSFLFVRCISRFILSAMMFAKCLAVVFLAALAVAEVPSFITVCGRKNPNLDKCMLEATNALRDRLKAGIPEINLPPQDPLYIEEFTLSNSDSLKAVGRNVTIRGIGDFITESMHGDLKAHQFNSVMRFKKIIIEGEYDVISKIIFPINAHGAVHIDVDDVVTDVVIKYNFVKINGADHIRYASVTTSLAVKNWTAVLRPSATMDSTLVTAIQATLEGARKEIFETIKPNVEKVISQITMDIANKVNENFTYAELFPDRE